VRIQGLPLALALILVGSLASLHNIDVSGRCVLPTSLQASKLAALKPAVMGGSDSSLNYTLEERDYLIRTMAFEAQGEPDVGKAAVAHVILNRKKSHRWGDTVKDVVMKPWQFEPWMTRRKEMENLSCACSLPWHPV
jgi:conjugal transfer mating pair stabilization protein TraG